jgi:hypothetical protein
MIRFALYFVFVLLFSCSGSKNPQNTPFTSVEGWDFSDWDFEKDGSVELSQGIQFFPNKLLSEGDEFPSVGCQFYVNQTTPPSPRCNDSKLSKEAGDILLGKDTPILVSSGHHWDFPETGNMGYAVYRIPIKGIQGRVTVYSEKINFFPNFRIWIYKDSKLELMAKAGFVSKDLSRSQYGSAQLVFSWEGSADLLIESSNSRFRIAGMTDPLILGDPIQIQKQRDRGILSNMAISGLVMMTGLYHVIFYFIIRKNSFLLSFGIYSILVSLRSLITNDVFLNYAEFDPLLLLKWEYGSLPLIVFASSKYVHGLFENKGSRMVEISITLISSLFFVVLMVGDIEYLSSYLICLQIQILVNILYSIFIMILSFNSTSFQSRLASRTLLSLVVFYFIIVIHDVLLTNGMIKGYELLGLGAVVFELGNAVLLAKINARAWENSEVLSSTLQKEFLDKMELQKKQTQSEKDLLSASDQLIQAEKLSSLGAMVSGIAHEINNPVNFIEMSRFQEKEELEDLKKYLFELIPDSEESRPFRLSLEKKFQSLEELNSQIQTGVKRVVDINHSMRNAARMDLQKEKNVNLSEVIEESLLILGAKTKEFQIQKNLDQNCTAEVRRSQIGQIVMNLVSNSADAIKEKKETDHPGLNGIIQVSLYLKDGTAFLVVEDNGPGIPEENRDKVMNSFFTTKKVGVGTGLGLAIVGKIVEGHQGKIEISTSNLGGAKFTVQIPQ